jgi:CspA family cold shock protein
MLSAGLAKPGSLRPWGNAVSRGRPVVPEPLKNHVSEGGFFFVEDAMTGTVKWFSRVKGWGFIEPDQGERDVFVHYENILGEGFRNLEKGERVSFRVEDTPKGPKALDVVIAAA